MKRFLKYLFRTIFMLMVLLFFAISLLYLPVVQKYIRTQAEGYLSSHFGWEVSIGDFAVGFPLNVTIDKAFVKEQGKADTVLYAEQVKLNVGIRKILWKQISLDGLLLKKVKLALRNDSTGLQMKVDVDTLWLEAGQVDLGNHRVKLRDLILAGGAVMLVTPDKTIPDTVEGKPFDWSIIARHMAFRNITYRMESASLPYLFAGIGDGKIAGGEVDIGKQYVNVDTVDIRRGHCSIRTAESAGQKNATVEDTVASSLWTVRAGVVLMEDNAFSLASGGEKETVDIILSGIGIRLDSLYNRGTVVRGKLRDLRLLQQDGIRVENMRADVALDSADTRLAGVYIKTPNSLIRLDATAAGPLADLMERVPIQVNLNARIGLADLTPFYGGLPEELRGKTLDIDADCRLSDDRVSVSGLQMAMPGIFQIAGKGQFSSIRRLDALSGEFALSGTLPDASFVNSFLKGGGITIPRNLTFSADVKAAKGLISPKIRLCQGEGCVLVDGSYNIPVKKYDVDVTLNNFRLDRFMPQDSLGAVTAKFRLAGKDMVWDKAEANLSAEIQHFVYKSHDYQGVNLTADLKKTRLSGRLESKDSSARLDLFFKGDSAGMQYAVELTGGIEQVNLYELNLAPSDLAVSLDVNVRGALGKLDTCSLYSVLGNIKIIRGEQVFELGDLTLDMSSDRSKTTLGMGTGDFLLAFRSDTALLPVVKMFSNVAAEARRQIAEGDLDMELLQNHLPVFSFNLKGAENNALSKYLKLNNIGFKKIGVDIVSPESSGLRVNAEVKELYLNKVQLDSVKLELLQRDKVLDYSIGLANSAEGLKDILNMNISGTLQKDQLRLVLKQQDSQGRIGFDSGLDLTFRDSSYSVSLFPMTPIMGYQRWILNADNRVTVTKDWKIKANLRLAYQNKLVSIQSLPDEGQKRDRLQVEINGVDLGSISKTMPFVPDISGVLKTDLMLYSEGEQLAADGHISVKDLFYTQRKVGTVDLDMNYVAGNRFSEHAVHFELRLDSIKRVLVEGQFFTSEQNKGIAIDLDLPSLPLYLVNVFVPDNIIRLAGELGGKVNMRGTFDKPLISGGLNFRDGRAELVMLGTTFGLDSSRIGIRNSKVLFDKYHFIAPNKSTLMINGGVDLTSFAHIMTDLSLKGDNFQIVNVAQNPNSFVYGKAYADVNVGMKGEFSSLHISGNVSLLNNTVIDYTLRSSDPELKDRSLDLVRFVPFRDTTLTGKDLLTNRINTNSFNLKLLVEIGNNVSMNVNLSEDGENKVAIQGGGNLIYSMNQESGNTLIGKYTLTGGTVRYGMPIVGQKLFSIQSGSYVEWTGNLLNPLLNISASESIRANVMEAEQASRLVNFESIIRIQNTLEQPEITFDLSAPSDMSIQNQLATFSPEERTKQAMNLLIYGTYTGPGAIASTGGTANNTLNNFVESELNQWSRKYLKNAGLTFGVDSYNQYSSSGEETKRTDYSYQFNKQLFNDRVSVKIGGRLSTDNEPGNTNMEQNLVDDIAIEYVFDKNRNLFLKVFRHTNYESVLEGEVTQTGVGIVLRKSFRKVRDLFIRKSRREEKNRELQEKRQAKEEGRDTHNENDTVK